MKHQEHSGGWGSGGDERARAMWAVLGLVSVDTLTVSVGGVEDGMHVAGTLNLRGWAVANNGKGVRDVRLFVDDRPIGGACGEVAAARWDTAALAPGRHHVEVQATDGEGRVSKRRIEVYSGAFWLTKVGSIWEDGGSALSARNVGPAPGTLRLEIFALEGDKPATRLHHEEAALRAGPNRFHYAGEAGKGASLLAKLSVIDTAGNVAQVEELRFVHADPVTANARYASVAGKVAFDGGGDAENAWVELLNDAGDVVQRVATTREGNYRFKGVEADEYQVRVVKEGFVGSAAPVSAKPASAAAAPETLTLK